MYQQLHLRRRHRCQVNTSSLREIGFWPFADLLCFPSELLPFSHLVSSHYVV